MIVTAINIKNDILDEENIELAISMCNIKYVPVDELESLLKTEHKDDKAGALRITNTLRKYIFAGGKL